MNKRDSMKLLASAIVLASAVAVAEEWNPSGFEPAPVFEDEGPARSSVPSRTPHAAAKITEPVAVPAAKVAPPPVVGRPEPEAARSETAPAATARPSGAWADILVANYPVGLIVLALTGYVFWSIGRTRSNLPQAPKHPAAASECPANTGNTGVARYLAGLGLPAREIRSTIGVAKYLGTREK